MDPSLLRDGLTVALGVGTGIMSGVFGVGGAVVSTPGIRLLGCPAALAVGTTLPSIIPGAAAGTARYARAGSVDWAGVAVAAPAGVLTAILGALLSSVVPGDGHLLMLATAGLLGLSAVQLGRPARAAARAARQGLVVESDAEVLVDAPDDLPVDESQGAPDDAVAHPHGMGLARRPGTAWRLALVGGLAGCLSGLLGVGGGIVMVPGFVQLAHLPVKRAIATSLACVAIFAIPGTITHALLGDIDWRFALLLAVGVIPGARIGAAIALRASEERMRRVVAIFLGVASVLYAVGETVALFH